MSIAMDFEWHDLPGRSTAEVAATMARLEIRIDDQVVTLAFDKRGRSVRDGIITPLAPIADWIAANWWALLEECATPARPLEDFQPRHFLRAAERGFALPDLRITTEGEATYCEWLPRATQFAPINFFSQGAARVPTSELRDVLWNFAEAVAARLNERNVVDARFPTLWNSVRATTPDEVPFCRIAGRLGLDPYEIDPALAAQVATLDRELSEEIRGEFAAAISAGRLSEGVRWITAGVTELRRLAQGLPTRTLPPLTEVPGNGTPWSRGYRLAREFRRAVGHSTGRFDLDSVSPIRTCFTNTRDTPAGLNAVIRRHGAEPLIYSAPQRSESLRFLQARALFACCERAAPGEALLTAAHTAWQQESRAFAAELLAPEDYLRARVPRDTLEPDEVSELAAELEVSPWVIERQIVNHGIAHVEFSDSGRTPHAN